MKNLLILVTLLAVTIGSTFFVQMAIAHCDNCNKCDSYYTDQYQCSGDWIQRKYKTSDCNYEWQDYKYCDNGCYGNGYCYDYYYQNQGCDSYYGCDNYYYTDNYYHEYYKPGCHISISVSTPSDVYVGDTATSTVTVTNDGTSDCKLSFTPRVCSYGAYNYWQNCDADGCQYMTCRISDYSYGDYYGDYYYNDGHYYYNYGNDPTVYVHGYGGSVSFDCTKPINSAGTYRVKVHYTYGYSVTQPDPYIYSTTFQVYSRSTQTTTTTVPTTTTSTTIQTPTTVTYPIVQQQPVQPVYSGYFIFDSGLTLLLIALILILLVVVAFILIFERQNLVRTLRTPV